MKTLFNMGVRDTTAIRVLGVNEDSIPTVWTIKKREYLSRLNPDDYEIIGVIDMEQYGWNTQCIIRMDWKNQEMLIHFNNVDDQYVINKAILDRTFEIRVWFLGYTTTFNIRTKG